jgi:hypothetical protein
MAVEDRVAYHVCRRCTLILVDGRFGPDTILRCRDCWDEEKIEVRMEFVPISPH